MLKKYLVLGNNHGFFQEIEDTRSFNNGDSLSPALLGLEKPVNILTVTWFGGLREIATRNFKIERVIHDPDRTILLGDWCP